jgi:opacity protein-like surface antigen
MKLRQALILAAALALASLTARAQETPKVEVFGGYSLLRADGDGGPSSNLNGWQASLAGNLNRHFGVVAEFSGHYGNERVRRSELIAAGVPVPISSRDTDPDPVYRLDSRAHTFLFGPRLSFRQNPRVTPFAHALVGGTRASVRGTIPTTVGNITAEVNETAFSATFGGGLDVKLTDGLAWRVIQADYLLTRFDGSTQNNARFSTGLVLRFGSR